METNETGELRGFQTDVWLVKEDYFRRAIYDPIVYKIIDLLFSDYL